MTKYIKKPTLYLDMDGVLADFNHAARTLLKATVAEERLAQNNGRWPHEKWRKIANDKHFYRNLPKTPIADRLVDMAMQFKQLGWDIKVLTAIPKGNDMPDVFHDKIDWINEYYPGLRVHFGPYSDDKHLHCHEGDILIDDRTSNCKEWRAARGIAIQVLDSRQESALQELSALFQETLTLGFV